MVDVKQKNRNNETQNNENWDQYIMQLSKSMSRQVMIMQRAIDEKHEITLHTGK